MHGTSSNEDQLESVTANNCFRLIPRRPIAMAKTDHLAKESEQRVYLIGSPESVNGPSASVDRIVTMHNNHIVGFDKGFQAYYSTATTRGMSGAPGVMLDGTLVCMHRAAGAKSWGGDTVKAFFNVGLRIDLFIKHAFGHQWVTGRKPKVHATVNALWNEIKEYYETNT